MRIEKVVIQNINSLAGRFEIDFANPRYSEGLFAIVGSSGAGKSTVLDAICLALYGKTPRIGTISESHNEIMTKNQDECSAEVVFWSRGKKYKSTFSHRRAKKAKSPFRQVKREIIEYDQSDGTGTIVASMIKEVCTKIVEITGLEYSQFSRSIMLAQFQFAEFLKADSNVRADILEQISDMDIYRTISAAVYDKTKREEASLVEIRAQMEVIKVLDEPQQKNLETELMQIDDAIVSHNKLEKAFADCRDTIRKIDEYEKALVQYEKDKSIYQQKLAEQNKRLEEAKEDEQKQKQQQLALRQTLKIVRDLDIKTAGKMTDINRLDDEITKDNNKIDNNKKIILDIFRKYLPNAENAQLKSLYESDNAADTIQAGAKADLDKATKEETSVRNDMQQILRYKDPQYWQSRIDLLEIVLPMVQAKKAIEQAERSLKELLAQKKGYETSKKALETEAKEIEDKFDYVRLEQRFGQERQKLEKGKPCPLCGAIEHPNAHKPYDDSFLHVVQQQKDDVSKKMEEIQQNIRKNDININRQEDLVKEQTKVVQANETKLQKQGGRLADVGVDIQADGAVAKIEQEMIEAKGIVRQNTTLLTKLTHVSQRVLKYTTQLSEVDKHVSDVEHNKQTIQDIEQQLRNRQKERQQSQTLYDEYAKGRCDLFGQKDADEEEKKVIALVDKAQLEKETCRAQSQKVKTQVDQNINDIERTQKAIEKEDGQLQTSYTDGKERVADVCKMPCLGDEETKTLFEEVFGLVASLGDKAKQNKEAITQVAGKLNELSSKETERKGRVSQQLADNEQSKRRLKQMRHDEKNQEKMWAKWNRLNAVIGSSKGDKFSRMAQGITFEVLLQYANSSLHKMSDRYILVRDDSNISKPLEISVVDNYQAGDSRPVSNLSGGESFIVSMALALGLSEMSSNKTRIDSLFIDEGFASLDEDYLEAALQTLSSLGNRENKLVGVISHVGALKERIDTKIQVSKLSGGRSTLDGPGVTVLGE